jgi:hypothetical protein
MRKASFPVTALPRFTTWSLVMPTSGLSVADFEDAVVCAVAEAYGCDGIVTRNLVDFGESPVRSMSPEEFLMEVKSKNQDH